VRGEGNLFFLGMGRGKVGPASLWTKRS